MIAGNMMNINMTLSFFKIIQNNIPNTLAVKFTRILRLCRNCYSNIVHQEDKCPKETVKSLTYHDFEEMKPDDNTYYESIVLK